MSVSDPRRFMRRALALARRGRGRVSPNPLVGAVVVKEGHIVGEGTHFFELREHAEAVALRRAGDRARGGELHVNLEPCKHHGRTPPCAQLILDSGIERVYYSIEDPNVEAGGGAAWLRDRGVRVEGGVMAGQARRLNEIFLHFAMTGLPFVLLKLGMTLDGRIAGPHRDSRWITGEKSRRQVHRLRHEYDAILVGVETLLADNPALDVRTARPNTIRKIVLDSHLRTPADSRIFDSGDPVTIFHCADAAEDRRAVLGTRCDIEQVPVNRRGLEWETVLQRLGGTGVTSVLVEGGGQVAASALAAGVISKLTVFYGPKIIGSGGVAGVGDLGINSLSEALKWRDLRLRRLGDEVMLEAYPQRQED